MPTTIYPAVGAITGPGLGAKETRADEDALVAALGDRILAAPGLSLDYVNVAHTGFFDRYMGQGYDRLSRGNIDVRTRMLARAGENPTYYTAVGSVTPILLPSYNATGDFTIPFIFSLDNLATDQLRLGSGDAPGGGTFWFATSDSSGRLRVGTGVVNTAAVDYAGPNLVAGTYYPAAVELNRTLSRFRLRLGNAWVIEKTDASYATAVFNTTMAVGNFSALASGAQPCRFVSPRAISGVLSDDELALLHANQLGDIAQIPE